MVWGRAKARGARARRRVVVNFILMVFLFLRGGGRRGAWLVECDDVGVKTRDTVVFC